MKGKGEMRKEYDFAKSVKNPYAKKLNKQITIRVENEIIEYFQQLSAETGISYQKLIHLFLRDCVQNERKPTISWKPVTHS